MKIVHGIMKTHPHYKSHDVKNVFVDIGCTKEDSKRNLIEISKDMNLVLFRLILYTSMVSIYFIR